MNKTRSVLTSIVLTATGMCGMGGDVCCMKGCLRPRTAGSDTAGTLELKQQNQQNKQIASAKQIQREEAIEHSQSQQQEITDPNESITLKAKALIQNKQQTEAIKQLQSPQQKSNSASGGTLLESQTSSGAVSSGVSNSACVNVTPLKKSTSEPHAQLCGDSQSKQGIQQNYYNHSKHKVNAYQEGYGSIISKKDIDASNKSMLEEDKLNNDISDDIVLSDDFFDGIKYQQSADVDCIKDDDNYYKDTADIADIMNKTYVKNENNICDDSRDKIIVQISKLDRVAQSYVLKSTAQSIIYVLQSIVKQINNDDSIADEAVKSAIKSGNCFIEDFPNYLTDIGDTCGACDVKYRIQQIQDAQKYKNIKSQKI